MKQKHRLISYLISGSVLLVLAVLAYYYWPSLERFFSPSYLREYLLGLGAGGFLLFVIILSLSILLPIPSTPIAVLGGYLYGTFLGTVLGVIATVIGSVFSFLLIRTYGLPLLEKLVDKHQIIHLSRILQKRGNIAALISYSIPLFPNDSVSLTLGLTNIRFLTFLALVTLGNIPRFLLLNSFGEDLSLGFSIRTVILVLLAGLFLLIAIFRKPLKRLLFREIKLLEKEAEKEIVVVETKIGKEIKLVERELKQKPKLKTKIPSRPS